MTSKQRAFLRSLAMKIDPVLNIGKGGYSPEIVDELDRLLEKRELVKVQLLQNCLEDIKEMASVLSDRTHSEVVQVIGRRIIFYRESKENKEIVLPKK